MLTWANIVEPMPGVPEERNRHMQVRFKRRVRVLEIQIALNCKNQRLFPGKCNCLYSADTNFIILNFLFIFMICILSSNTPDHLCLACLRLILAVLFKTVAAATSPKFRMTYKCLNRETKKMGDMVWFVANGFSCQAVGNRIWASFAFLIGTIASQIAFRLQT